MSKIKRFSVLLIFLIFSTVGMGSHQKNLTISKDLNFEVEIVSSTELDLEPVIIDFGNLLRDSNDTVTKTGFLNFKTAFEKDNKITMTYIDTPVEDKEGYAKFQLDYLSEKKDDMKKNNQEKEKLDVYLKKIDSYNIKKGEIKVPVIAEIRGVPKDQKLGKYKKNIKVNVITTPIDPKEIIRISGKGGMK